ncbi:MAG TPA: hypothetical protein VOB72_21415 [Candidatus Dormibacteraeota bacterium]|nr:hypothetical protein [Candidatus Dormibacteraeota bacterium]
MTARTLPLFGAPAAAAAALLTLATAVPAAATSVVPVTLRCTASALGVTQTTTQTDDWTVSAPASVASGGWFDVTITPPSWVAPTMLGSATATSIKNVTLRITITNATLKGVGPLSGGSGNLGTTAVSISGGTIVVTASGPIPAGASWQLPSITLSLTAGTAGMPATTSLTGTALTYTTVVRSGPFTINAPTSCTPVPDPTILTSTDVT